jgi:hypothetical protein
MWIISVPRGELCTSKPKNTDAKWNWSSEVNRTSEFCPMMKSLNSITCASHLMYMAGWSRPVSYGSVANSTILLEWHSSSKSTFHTKGSGPLAQIDPSLCLCVISNVVHLICTEQERHQYSEMRPPKVKVKCVFFQNTATTWITTPQILCQSQTRQ